MGWPRPPQQWVMALHPIEMPGAVPTLTAAVSGSLQTQADVAAMATHFQASLCNPAPETYFYI